MKTVKIEIPAWQRPFYWIIALLSLQSIGCALVLWPMFLKNIWVQVSMSVVGFFILLYVLYMCLCAMKALLEKDEE